MFVDIAAFNKQLDASLLEKMRQSLQMQYYIIVFSFRHESALGMWKDGIRKVLEYSAL